MLQVLWHPDTHEGWTGPRGGALTPADLPPPAHTRPSGCLGAALTAAAQGREKGCGLTGHGAQDNRQGGRTTAAPPSRTEVGTPCARSSAAGAGLLLAFSGHKAEDQNQSQQEALGESW